MRLTKQNQIAPLMDKLKNVFSKGIFRSCINGDEKESGSLFELVDHDPTETVLSCNTSKDEELEVGNAVFVESVENDSDLQLSWIPGTPEIDSNNPLEDKEPTRCLRLLIFIFDQAPKNHRCQIQYRTLQSHFCKESSKIHESDLDDETKSKKTMALFSTATIDMRKLIHKAEKIEEGTAPSDDHGRARKGFNSWYAKNIPKYDDLLSNALPSHRRSWSNRSRAAYVKSLEQIFRQKRCEQRVRQFLCYNWSRLHPSVEEMKDISDRCDVSQKYVLDWFVYLISTEVRSCFHKAFVMGRTVKSRGEDSFNLFCGLPLRPGVPTMKRPPLHPSPRTPPKPFKRRRMVGLQVEQ